MVAHPRPLWFSFCDFKVMSFVTSVALCRAIESVSSIKMSKGFSLPQSGSSDAKRATSQSCTSVLCLIIHITNLRPDPQAHSFFAKINNINKYWARLTEKKYKRPITSTFYMNEVTTTDTKDRQRVVRRYNNKQGNLEEM